jgi:hypothetical protein
MTLIVFLSALSLMSLTTVMSIMALETGTYAAITFITIVLRSVGGLQDCGVGDDVNVSMTGVILSQLGRSAEVTVSDFNEI